MKTHKITLPLFEAIEACAAVLPHASTDDVTPVITCASITGDRIVATDRYSVGTFKLSHQLDDGAAIMLPLDALKWVARIVTKHLIDDPRLMALDSYTVTIEAPESTTPGRPPKFWPGVKPVTGASAAGLAEAQAWRDKQVVAVSVESKQHGVEMLRKFRPVFGNFPPVGRLIDEHKPSREHPTVALGPRQLEKFTGYAKKYHRDAALKFTLSATDNPNKPGPVFITIGDKFVGLLQPNLLLR